MSYQFEGFLPEVLGEVTEYRDIAVGVEPDTPNNIFRDQSQYNEQNLIVRDKTMIDGIKEAEKRAVMSELWADENLSGRDVADEYNRRFGTLLTPKMVQYKIQHQIRKWERIGLKAVATRKAMALARIEQLEALAQDAYFASMEGRTIEGHQSTIDQVQKKSKKNNNTIREQVESVFAEVAGRNGYVPNEVLNPDGALADNVELVNQKIHQYRKLEHNKAGDVKFLKLMRDLNRDRIDIYNLTKYDTEDDPNKQAALLTDDERTTRVNTIFHNAKIRAIAGTMGLAQPEPLGGFKEETENADAYQ
jgi:hypothetical protein